MHQILGWQFATLLHKRNGTNQPAGQWPWQPCAREKVNWQQTMRHKGSGMRTHYDMPSASTR